MTQNDGITKTAKTLLIAGQVGCVLFALLFLMQDQFREGYAPLKFPVSSLSIGQYGWIQRVNFLISGLLILLSSFGFYKATTRIKGHVWTTVFFGAMGLGLMGAGTFNSDPVYGYPLTEPFHAAQYTATGRLHEFFSLFFFIGVPVTCFKMHNRFRAMGEQRSACLSIIVGFAVLAGLFLTGAGFKQVPYLVKIAGLLQRLTIIFSLSWVTFLLQAVIRHATIKE